MSSIQRSSTKRAFAKLRTFPAQLVQILKILKVDARHLQDDFAPDTEDIDWLPEVGRKGWVVVTGDRRISNKPPERKALEEANVIAVLQCQKALPERTSSISSRGTSIRGASTTANAVRAHVHLDVS
jgi:hypothetical protein